MINFPWELDKNRPSKYMLKDIRVSIKFILSEIIIKTFKYFSKVLLKSKVNFQNHHNGNINQGKCSSHFSVIIIISGFESFQKIKEFLFENIGIFEILYRFNKYHLVTVSRDLQEYVSGFRSRRRLFAIIISRIITLITCIKWLMCGLINEVSIICSWSYIY